MPLNNHHMPTAAYIDADSGYPWLTCDRCGEPLECAEGGTTLDSLISAWNSHSWACAAPSSAPNPAGIDPDATLAAAFAWIDRANDTEKKPRSWNVASDLGKAVALFQSLFDHLDGGGAPPRRWTRA